MRKLFVGLIMFALWGTAVSQTQTPYGGTPMVIPGTVETENYDLGGQNIAFNDLTTINSGGAYRTDAVDMEACTEGGFNVGWIENGEWLEYTVNVTQAGTYTIDARVAATVAGKTFRLELDGVVLGNYTLPNTGAWQTWQTVSLSNISLTTGTKVLRVFATSTDFNLSRLVFTRNTTNANPTTTITSPLNNATFTAPGTITINANASDDGSVSKVEFFNGATKLGEDLTSPYSFVWTNVAAGTYTLTTRATDNTGLTGTSAAITIVGGTNTAPTTSITSPANNATFIAPASVTINANAADANGTVSKVEFFNGATKLGEDLTSPYSFVWTNVAAGTYTLTTRATDNLNATGTSAAITIVVNPIPSQSPYGGTAWAIPGTVEAEHYDLGGQNNAFNDLSTANNGGAFRTDAVDIEACTEGGFNVGWIEANEWLEYTVNVTQAGAYTIDARVAATTAGRTFRLELDGVALGNYTVPNTGSWQGWQTVSLNNINLTTGTKVLRVFATGAEFNFNRLVFTRVTTNLNPTAIITSPSNNASFNAPASITINANASDDVSVSKVEFYNGATKIGEDLTSPYSFNWTNVAAGTYALTARAIDNVGAIGNSAIINVTVIGTTTNINGLAVLVEYSNASFPESIGEVTAMLNTPGYLGWGNVGSVRDYFYTQTNGKLNITCTVIKISLPFPSSQHYGPGGHGDMADFAAAIRAKYPSGFQNLTLMPDGSIKHFMVLSKADAGAWAFGQQPGDLSILNNGVPTFINNGCVVAYPQGQAPQTSVIGHEMGHSVFGWTDYYQTAFCNFGDYDVMGSAGTAKGPAPMNPALRMQKGWINNIIEINGSATTSYTLTANDYTEVHKYTNPNNPKEYLLFHVFKHGGYYNSPMDNGKILPEGLAIWYVDEESGYNTPGQDTQWFIRMVQADNKDELHDEFNQIQPDIRSDLEDLYGNANKSFPNGHPLRWKDGGEFGINISNISNPGTTMSFTVNARPNTVIASTDMYGTISPKGTLSAATGENKSFTLIPDIGYEINTIKVNGVTVANANPFVLTNISGTRTLAVTYKKKAVIDPLPNPWQMADIGSGVSGGLGTYAAGKFSLQSFGNSVQSYHDSATFVYQTMTGDGSIVARIVDYNKPSRKQRVGIMLRASLDQNAIQSMIMKHAHGGVQVDLRNDAGTWLWSNPNGIQSWHIYSLFNWMKITRAGNQITSFCSKDGVSWVQMGQQTMNNLPPSIFVGLVVTGANAGVPAKATFDNVTVTQTCSSIGGTKLNGTVIGTLGSWNNSGNTREKAFDNNVTTYFDAPEDIAWTGLSVTNQYRITGIRFYPREGATGRMVGGRFQASNTADFSSGVVDLATISIEPILDWNCVEIPNPWSFRYFRYISPAGGVGNVAEVEFYGVFTGAKSTTDIMEMEEAEMISSAHPNPFNDVTTITIPESMGSVEVSVFNATGELIKTQFASSSFELGSEFKNGFYLIKLVSPAKTETLRVVKQSN